MSNPAGAGVGAESSESSGGGVSNQLAALVPTFDPSKDDLQIYTQKVELVLAAWPQGRLKELVTRLILGCQGSAFQKLQIHQTELLTGEEKSVKRVIELLGNHWGRIGLEKKFEDAELALFQTQQRADEANDSYLARADIMWSKLLARKMKLEELQAYVLLRGSQLTPEEKKRVILDSDNSLEGELTLKRVTDSIRMLGAGFFQDMTGQKKNIKTKIYDQAALVATGDDEPEDVQSVPENSVDLAAVAEDDFVDQLINEGEDLDAVFLADFEGAAAEILQSDPELSMAFSAYSDARKRLSDKFKNRGFWPVTGGKGRGSSWKGKNKGKGKGSSVFAPPFDSNAARKSLKDRILSSNCRACGRKGHWKAECPYKASVEDSVPPLEFLQLPLAELPTLDVTCLKKEEFICFVQEGSDSLLQVAKNRLHESFCQIQEKYPKVGSLSTLAHVRSEGHPRSLESRESLVGRKPCHLRESDTVIAPRSLFAQRVDQSNDCVLFATHGSCGVLDLGATKTVMGSSFITEFLQGLSPSTRKQISRCKCKVTFRFGNQGTLTSDHALVIPIGRLKLKIAIVKGATPFLLSNTLMRALQAQIDCQSRQVTSPKLSKPVKLELTSKGLFLMDINDLVAASGSQTEDTAQDTFVTEDRPGEKVLHANPREKETNQSNEIVRNLHVGSDASSLTCSSKLQSTQLNKAVSFEQLSGMKEPLCMSQEKTCVEPSDRVSDQDPFPKNPQNRDRWTNVEASDEPLPAPEKCANSSHSRGDSGGTSGNLWPSDTGRFLGIEDRVREHSHREAVPGSVGERTGMGLMVCESLSEQSQSKPSPLSTLCRGDDRSLRGSRGSDGAGISPDGDEGKFSATLAANDQSQGKCQKSDAQGNAKVKGPPSVPAGSGYPKPRGLQLGWS